MGFWRDFSDKIIKTKVLEVFSMMALLSVANSLIGFLVYPFVIRALGPDPYGLYVLAYNIVGLFIIVVLFGLDVPCAKMVVHHRDNKMMLGHIVSAVLISRLTLWGVGGFLLLLCFWLASAPVQLFYLVALTLVSRLDCVLMPVCYYQGLKRMRVVTIISLSIRLASVPVIIFFVCSPSDLLFFASVGALMGLMAGIASMGVLIFKDRLPLRLLSLSKLKPFWQQAFPFFLSDLGKNVKTDMMGIIIGLFFGLRDLAVYDLAQKILTVPRILIEAVNKALFPEFVDKATAHVVGRMLRYEALLGFAAALGLTAIGWPMVYLLGGESMLEAFPVLAVMSLTLFSWLIVGVYQNFVFVPAQKYFLVTLNQLVALVSSLILLVVGLFLWSSPIVAAIALVISSFVEVFFCRAMVRRNALFQ